MEEKYPMDTSKQKTRFEKELEDINNVHDIARFSIFVSRQRNERNYWHPHKCSVCGNYNNIFFSEFAIHYENLWGNITLCPQCCSEIDKMRKFYLLFYIEKLIFFKFFMGNTDIFNFISEIFVLICKKSEFESTRFIQTKHLSNECRFAEYKFIMENVCNCDYCRARKVVDSDYCRYNK